MGGSCDLYVGDSTVDSVIYVYGFSDLIQGDLIRIEIPKLQLSTGISASLNFEVVESTPGEANGGFVTLY